MLGNGLSKADLPRHTVVQASPRHRHLSIQRFSLILLVVQNSALVMVMHYSRHKAIGSEPRYLASTAVLFVEITKLLVSLGLETHSLRQSYRSSKPSERALLLYRSVLTPDSWKLVVPAALYTLQSTLVYVAISNLDAVTFQVTYQLKILTTVLFSVILRGKNVSLRQWLALILLTCGVTLLQVSSSAGSSSSPGPTWRDRLAAFSEAPTMPTSNTSKGLLAVLAASLTSGLTCVYFEKLVKDSLTSVSIWTRNVQLSLFSLFPALFIGVLWQDGAVIWRDGFFAGYNPIVWLTIALQALGGLVVAVCIAYADNVAKNFAASLSIVVTYAASALVFRKPLMFHSTSGAVVVLLAMYLYNSRPQPKMQLLPIVNERMPEKQKVVASATSTR
ncbi:nucleotide-sugar transporter [Coniochaeta sp. PMI_546]|nr:nucleotide-sugar transporter [Coniochaeta sp. PMI_546]